MLPSVDKLYKLVLQVARDHAVCRCLMMVPGVGVVVALNFIAAIEDPARFKKSPSVGAILGMVPREHQSGEIDRNGRITKTGDREARAALFEAAHVGDGSGCVGTINCELAAGARLRSLAESYHIATMSDGKEQLGWTSGWANDAERLLIIGASPVAGRASRKGVAPGTWLTGMMPRKPPMLVRVALANKMARVVWALLAHGGGLSSSGHDGVSVKLVGCRGVN